MPSDLSEGNGCKYYLFDVQEMTVGTLMEVPGDKPVYTLSLKRFTEYLLTQILLKWVTINTCASSERPYIIKVFEEWDVLYLFEGGGADTSTQVPIQ